MNFKGGLEPKVHKRLQAICDPSMIVDYETDKLPYHIMANYTPDFPITLSDGHIVYLEVKGYFSVDDRRKMQAVFECYPDLDIRMVFDKDNKLNKNAKMTYGGWCDKRGIKWTTLQNLTKEWLYESNDIIAYLQKFAR